MVFVYSHFTPPVIIILTETPNGASWTADGGNMNVKDACVQPNDIPAETFVLQLYLTDFRDEAGNGANLAF